MKMERLGVDLTRRRNFHLVLLIAMYLIVVIMPAILDILFPPPSSSAMLQRTPIKIISAKSTVPNVVGEISSGRVISANFAQSTMLFPIGKVRYFGIPESAINQLAGCSGWAEFDVTKNFLYPKYRIWVMSCGDAHLDKRQSENYFRSTRKTGYIVSILESFLFLILALVVCISNRRPNGRRE
ncbi:hypothetical protein [Burkholderia sp. 3C]